MAKVVYKIGDDVSTDIIYPGRYMATVLPTETPQYAFADDKDFNNKLNGKEIPAKSYIVAGDNFGCGSSREQAASCLKGWDPIIIARHVARIFLQNAINLGLQMVICPDIDADLGDELEIDGEVLKNITKGKEFKIVPLPPSKQAIIDAGGLVEFIRARLLAEK
ncbi:MAG: 3-isopropylmalate dehydratase small subunit [candidate division Zixibacteria bacterium]|nr:3-isopropylmalate dehydratase small subunit [candidate division Zixibacteria bacterium]